MAAKNKYDVILEKIGNQPLKTTKVLCSALGLGLAAAKGMVDKAPVTIATGIDEAKALDLKKQLNELGNTVSVPGLEIEDEAAPAKITTLNKTAAATDDAFDAIFGAGSAQKATPPVKSKGTTKTETKKTTSKASAKTETKTTTKKKTAAACDDFDALFGGATSENQTKSQLKVPEKKIERVKYDNGSYEGEMVDGLRHGKGKYIWNDGAEYEGDWVKGKRCGFGIYKSYSKNEKDGSTYTSYIYEGEWNDSKKHGRGVAKGYKAFPLFGHVYMSWSYDGPWVNDNKHGHGIYWEWDGNAIHEMWKIFEGEWIDNTRQGLFTMKYEPSGTGKTYINYYVDGSAEVWGAPYDPSIKTLEDARRAKQEADSKERREYDERRAREAAQSRTTETTYFDDDAMSDLRYLYEMKSSGGTLSWSAEEQQKYQTALICRKGDRDGVALAYVKQRVYENSLSSFSQADVNFCIYLLNEIIPREDTQQELAICYYRKGWVKDASGITTKRELNIIEGQTWAFRDFEPDEFPYSDEIMARRLLDKVIYSIQNTFSFQNPTNSTSVLRREDPESVLRCNIDLQEKVLLAEAYLSYAKKERRQYQITEIEEDLITLKTLMK